MKLNPKLVVIIGAFGVSMSPIFIKLSASPALTIGFYRMFLTVLILTPYILVKNLKEIRTISTKNKKRIVISGIFLGLHFSAWIISLKYTTVASATVLVNTSPILLLFITYFLFKEHVTFKQVSAIVLAFIGSAILALGDFSGGQNAILGDLYALSGAGFVCVYLIMGGKVRQELSMSSYSYLTYAVATLTIFVSNLFVGHSLAVNNPYEYLLFLCMAIFPTLLGHSLFSWSLKYVTATYVSMAILTEPVLASIFAIFIFNEIPTLFQIIGSIIIIGSIAYYNNTKN